MRIAAEPERAVPELEPEPPMETGLISASEAARRLGISGRAVRKRIASGTLKGTMIDGAWHVLLGPEPVAEPERGRPEPEQGTRNGAAPSVPPLTTSPRSQFDAVMQEWIAPLAARIETLARENGELTADLRHEHEQRMEAERECAEARAEANDLAAYIKAFEMVQTHQEPQERVDLVRESAFPPHAPHSTGKDTQGPQRRSWWRVLLGLDLNEER